MCVVLCVCVCMCVVAWWKSEVKGADQSCVMRAYRVAQALTIKLDKAAGFCCTRHAHVHKLGPIHQMVDAQVHVWFECLRSNMSRKVHL